MVKRRKARKTRRTFFKAKPKRRKASRSSSLMNLVLGAGLYGLGREYVSGLISPITNALPLGQYTDEVAMLITSYGLSKGKIPLLNKIKILREAGKAGIAIESSNIGRMLMAGQRIGVTATSNSLNATVI